MRWKRKALPLNFQRPSVQAAYHELPSPSHGDDLRSPEVFVRVGLLELEFLEDSGKFTKLRKTCTNYSAVVKNLHCGDIRWTEEHIPHPNIAIERG